MDVLVFVSLLIAVILFALDAFAVRTPRFAFLPAGLFFFALAFLLPSFETLG